MPYESKTARVRRIFACVAVVAIGTAATVMARLYYFSTEAPLLLTHRVVRGDLTITVDEQGLLESADNVEVKSKVRGWNAVLWIIESGTFVNQGDELVRLDALSIQEQIDERTKYANWSQSAADGSAARVARASIAVSEYEQGRYRTEVLSLEKELAVAEASLRNATDRLRHVRTMASSGYISELEIEESEFAVDQLRLNLDLKKTELEVLRNFTHKEQMQTLNGNLQSVTASHKANAERAMADASRRDRAVEELDHCVILAEKSGLVIHPNAAKWESGPIAEGTNVHKDQLLLLMPDLNQMQVKVGVHEDLVKRVKAGQTARVVMAEGTLSGRVSNVASITKPAGWWTGNQVRYDTDISLPSQPWLRPGMSADVQITVAEYSDVLLVPVAAIVESNDKAYCWVQTAKGPERRLVELGDTDEVYWIVNKGLREGDEVLLNTATLEGPVARSSAGEAKEAAKKDAASSKAKNESSGEGSR